MRNQGPILRALRPLFSGPVRVLEIASGTGQHGAYFAAHLPQLCWQPTDVTRSSFESIEAWRAPVADRVAPPILLDVTWPTWPACAVDAIFCANMIHISPFETTRGLLRGAQARLPSGGLLILYGPFTRGGAHTASSNLAFDQSLRARDPRWGVRDLDAVVDLAGQRTLELEQVIEMPANNLTVVFKKV
ncbi:MAG: DUF938 domain-containing protein [Deltaproteobacteria bacterium]|nr:MAG: DUF938 domain-containing protein [Deltaproteobacteria bacterium]